MHYECKPDAFGGEELVMITTVEQIRQLCQPYINEIKNTELLVLKLMSFINEVKSLSISSQLLSFTFLVHCFSFRFTCISMNCICA